MMLCDAIFITTIVIVIILHYYFQLKSTVSVVITWKLLCMKTFPMPLYGWSA